MRNIFTIIVTYNPNYDVLFLNIKRLLLSSNVIIVDNTPDTDAVNLYEDRFSDTEYNVEYFALRENKGIAYAQNKGFIEGLKKKADFFILLDQDSNINDGFISHLMDEYNVAIEHFKKVAAIGPAIINERNHTQDNYEISKSVKTYNGIYDVDVLISSGSLIPVDALVEVGMNNSSLFIDLVDFEWCYRAKYAGYHVLMTSNVTMKHNVGLTDKKIWRGKYTSICSPFRLYYVFRNCIFAVKMPHFPLSFKFRIILSLPLKCLIHMTCDRKFERLGYICKGVIDGVLSRAGDYNKNWVKNKK
ncbi:glycosyltransferase family 2 protein [Citrobacter freundii]|uniref:glycosyltransferase family 2 protein n=1 Tax=Citrobacter TaxID=544 RepID=UPI000778D8D6|nr:MULTISPECIES: glycosyltransferase family 2 protein [Citrobacter]EJR7284782.1 glycosyltransferase family 2 protein [Citrobacter freundii]EKT9242058.1 glycosyltransferase family 2 protein [Citrobacter freundii]EKW8511836.1 glycosyltransferase family 2 protein [Citrobacter freundii]EMB4319278.1 glycosyltransferase family 2 protein [Citrobacter freundii]KYC27826.1 hypothetical protein WM44_05485 [Citrobacter sp. AATXQ]